MMRSIGVTVGVLAVLVAGAAARAELQLVENFDGLPTGKPDGLACSGVLGGTWDTQSENTGNVNIEDNSGSRVLQFRSHSSGTTRGVGFNGITNPIAEGETGMAFLRFMFRIRDGESPRTYIGFLSDTSDDPINGTSAGTPTDILAGIGLLDDGAGGFDITTTDASTVLKSGLARGQWYNVWIIANNEADTFDLYLSEAGGPAGEATLPTPEELVQSGIPFGVTTTDPLNGMIFACPNGTGQSTRTYVDEIWWDGDQGLSAPTTARNPSPANAEMDVPSDVILAWTGAPTAVKRDVYLGTSLADVGSATIDNPLGVLASAGQDANTYQPVEPLEFGTTYYWRVDEVNAPPDGTVFKGAVWSFTVEPFGYPIENVVASASSSSPDMGPEKTVDGSGLNDADEHSKEDGTMWLSQLGAPEPAWIQYEFDRSYKLDEMWVWNFNQGIEPYVGFGVKDVTIEYSADGNDWTTLEDVPEFTRAPGADGYVHDTTVAFGGVSVKFVKLTCTNNWGVLSQYGLSEVRFFHVPVQARGPEPADGATGVELDVTLNWRPGREAVSHEVYFSDDAEAVAAGTALVDTVDEHRFDVTSLDFGTVYSWKVDEVGEAASYPGEVWSFTTKEYAVIDDFESYNDDVQAGTTIFDTWIDGLTNNTGSVVGYWEAPFAEQTIVHGGQQSMPLDYNDVISPWYSEAYRDFSPAQDWTVNGADTLVLYFRGRPLSFLEPSPGSIIMSGAGSDIYGSADQFRFVYKALSGDGSIVARVESLEDTHDWAKVGVMIRESLNPGSRFAIVCATPANGVRFQARLLNLGGATSDTPVATPEQIALQAPVWVKVERSGDNFNGYYSTDGATWTAMSWNPQTISMMSNAYIGLAVTSHASGVLCTGEFSGITTSGGVSGPWKTAEIGVAQPSNTPAPLYVAVQDSGNHTYAVTHPDELATITPEWQSWAIPLDEFRSGGVDVTKVKRLYIGVGDRTSPQPGGAGLLYIDDIGFGHPAPGDEPTAE